MLCLLMEAETDLEANKSQARAGPDRSCHPNFARLDAAASCQLLAPSHHGGLLSSMLSVPPCQARTHSVLSSSWQSSSAQSSRTKTTPTARRGSFGPSHPGPSIFGPRQAGHPGLPNFDLVPPCPPDSTALPAPSGPFPLDFPGRHPGCCPLQPSPHSRARPELGIAGSQEAYLGL